jgi:acetyltransferase-like isoleucine patch superfamily enzyme
MSIVEKLYSKLRVILLKSAGSQIKGRFGLRYGVDIPRVKNKLHVCDFVSLDRNVSIVMTNTDQNINAEYLVYLGNNVYINRNTSIDATTLIHIDSDVMIGPNCYITDHDHDYKNQDPSTKIGALPLDGQATYIHKNVWIGANVVVLKGVTIGENSIIGAGSVVTKNISANVIAVGNPCRELKKR